MITKEALIEATKRILKDSSVENGAIVAANTDKNYHPRDVSSYRYVWIRDASYICVAADILGIGIQEDFFRWCLERAEGFDRDGVFYQTYHTNGAKAGGQFQPDQTGTLLWAVWYHYQERPEEAAEFKDLIEKAADGICKLWSRDHFVLQTYDLWEERSTFPDLEDNHTYSLAACAKGLRCADALMAELKKNGDRTNKWLRCAQEQEETIKNLSFSGAPPHDPASPVRAYKTALPKRYYSGYFLRTFGKINDSNVDASLLGLVYPFEICSVDDTRMVNTVNVMEKRIVENGGVHRYEKDVYDGWMQDGKLRSKGAGAWPLLNFWIAIYYTLRREREKAKKYHDWVLNRLDQPYIPEQIFENEWQKAVCPLVWAHAMFIISDRLEPLYVVNNL
ncbi:MAG: glycoside hydrolase family 15 protein [Halobacteriota archaeon]